MLRFKYDLLWSYVDVYCGDHKIGTINYVNTEEDAFRLAREMYENYIRENGIVS